MLKVILFIFFLSSNNALNDVHVLLLRHHKKWGFHQIMQSEWVKCREFTIYKTGALGVTVKQNQILGAAFYVPFCSNTFVKGVILSIHPAKIVEQTRLFNFIKSTNLGEEIYKS